MSLALASEDTTDSEMTFSVASGAVLQRMRTSISEMLNNAPSVVRSTRDLQKLFGLDLKLCWQVMKLAGPGDALSLAPFVPTAGPMRRFLNAASSSGVPAPVVDKVRLAYAAFEEQVAIHAGDRMTFESMATGSVSNLEGSDEDLRRADIKHRKAGFQMHSHYCGVQLDTYLSASLLHPCGIPGHFDCAHVRTKLGLRRLRAGADIPVDAFKYTVSLKDQERERDSFHKDVFDVEAFQKYGAPIIAKFCSNPLPQLKTVTFPDGKTSTAAVGESIGQRSSVNLVFGRIVRDVPPEQIEDGKKEGFGQSVSITVPTALVIADQLVHRPSFAKVDFKTDVRWPRFPFDMTEEDHKLSLPFRERIVRLESGVDGARTREVPQYIELLQFICDRLGWKIEDFDVYRLRVEYPILHTKITTDFHAETASV
jgi:hypothetical protein